MENNWIKVEDRLPNNKQNILAIIFKDNKFYVPFTCEYVDGKFKSENDDELGILDYTNVVTHWMELPQPPKLY